MISRWVEDKWSEERMCWKILEDVELPWSIRRGDAAFLRPVSVMEIIP